MGIHKRRSRVCAFAPPGLIKGGFALAAAVGALVLWPSDGRTQAFAVVPEANGVVEGDMESCVPFGLGCEGPDMTARYQQVYDASALGGESGVVDFMVLRLNCPGFGTEISGVEVQVRLSHTDAGPGTLSATFSDNLGPDETVVLDTASLDLFTQAVPTNPPNPCPYDFDLGIDFDNTFEYNGTDNLLVDVTVRHAPADIAFDAVSSNGVTSAISTIGPDAATATTADRMNAPALVSVLFLAPPDFDGDGIVNSEDNCVRMVNFDQADSNGDGHGDVCVPPGTLARRATLGQGAIVGLDSRIGRNSDVGENATIGNNVRLSRNVRVGDDLTTGDNVRIDRNARIGDGLTTGGNVRIGRSVRIGDGVMTGDNVRIDRSARLGDNVELGSSVRIERRARLSDDVMVGSDVRIGRGSYIGERVVIGDNVVIEPGVVIGPDVVIGDNTIIRRGAVIGAGSQIGSDVFIDRRVRIWPGTVVEDGERVRRRWWWRRWWF